MKIKEEPGEDPPKPRGKRKATVEIPATSKSGTVTLDSDVEELPSKPLYRLRSPSPLIGRAFVGLPPPAKKTRTTAVASTDTSGSRVTRSSTINAPPSGPLEKKWEVYLRRKVCL